MSDSEELLFHVDGEGIGFITLNRPRFRNALTFAMYERLTEICHEVNGDRGIKALVLHGCGTAAFAAGTDISQFRDFTAPEHALQYEERIDRALEALESCRVPTVAALAGACTGGGAAIAAVCDLRVAGPNLRFGFPIARTLGNCLSLANYARLAALIGPAQVKYLVFTASLVEAEPARAMGLVHELTIDCEGLLPRATYLARLAASYAPLTLRATKEALLRLSPRLSREEGRDLILMCYMSRDFREGLEAFLDKRAPIWEGR